MADTQTISPPETAAVTKAPVGPQRSRAEELLQRRRMELERREAAERAYARREPTIEFGEFLLMLFFAGCLDLVSLVPWLNVATVFVGNIVFSVWFWFKRLSFKKLRFVFAIEGIIEAVPFLSMLPGFIGLIVAAYVIHRAGRLLEQLPGSTGVGGMLNRRTIP
ncbi:hypothetical protein HYW67_01055 [Candidatus Parcubacteria bacterium]|nr:hypothetical protein [Candidatus Parcubacteria bacterium]